MDNLGKVAYDAYFKSRLGKDRKGNPLCTFEELTFDQQAAWVAAGVAVYHHVVYKESA